MSNQTGTGGLDRSDRSSWAVLRYRDFRLMYLTQIISATGSGMLLAVINWHIWKITQSNLALGLVGLVRIVPIISLSLLGGVVSDAVNRRKLLFVTQAMTLLFAALLAWVVLANSIPYVAQPQGLKLKVQTFTGQGVLIAIYVLTAAISGMGAFDGPARFALLPTLIPPERIGDAGRLNVVLFSTTAVIGPLIGSWLFTLVGPGITYGINALTIVPALLALLMIHPVPMPVGTKRSISLESLKEGLNFVWRDPLLRSSMLLDFFATFFSSAMALLPVYADQILKVGGLGYGFLYAAPAAGSVLGALGMAQLGTRVKRQGEVMLVAVACYGLATVVFGLSQSFVLSWIALAATGLSDSISASVRNAMRQILTPSRLRGRMQSVMMLFFQGGPQLGEFEAGSLAQATSAPFSVIVGGVGTLIAVGLMAVTIPVLRSYREYAQQPVD